ncbi:MAG TPA: BTAD domain-containing putative transcriptional regulator [Thermoleophilaceae bacterium]|nr:BTAD domain-containing putative transcriptional regulator [Thermoleophilaceae bacterium]
MASLAPQPAARIDFLILGPLEAFNEGRAVRLGGAKQRALLAVFLLHRGEALSTERLIDELWGDRPPATAAKTVQVHVSRLRKALAGGDGNGSTSMIVTREHGYELKLDPERLDAHRFERLVAEGRRELAAGRPERATAALERALSLWRGPPLADLAYEPFAQREIARLDDLRVGALEQLIEARLALGAHAELVERLETLIAEHPYRERLRAQLMLALYRSDRQAEALQAYQDARRTLVEELGIEPGVRLRGLERAILAQDPALAAPVGSDEADAAPRGQPRDKLPTGVVTFLLTDIEGSSGLWEADPEGMAAALELHDELIATTGRAHAGQLLKTKGEGDATLTVFPRASDAVAAAARLQEALAVESWPGGLELRLRIGLHTGEAHERGGDYFGPALNRAARLRALARGGVTVVSQATAEIVHDRLPPEARLVALGRRKLRGLTRPENVFELRRVAAQAAPPPGPVGAEPAAAEAIAETPRGALVGRERELAELVAGLDDAIAGRGRLILLAGEPGIGKSRLADELVDRAREGGAVTLFGRAWEAGGAPAYWPWVQAMRAYFRDRDTGTVRAQLGAGAADVAQMLPELRELLPDVGPPPSLDPEGARFRLFDATTAFLRTAAEVRPIVLVLDDLHAADAPSLLLLEFLAQHLAQTRVLVVGCYRDSELAPEHPLTGLAGHAAALHLTGLAEPDVARFIEAAEGDAPPPDVAAMIHRKTEGNPLFIGEIVRLLAVEGRRGHFALPASVRDTVGRRLRHVSEDCRRALTLAAVLGREFELHALARVSGQEVDALLHLVDEAIAAGAVGDSPGARGRLRFTHVLLRDALYEELTPTARMRLHRQAGEALESLYANDPEPHLAELAHHFYEAVPAADAGTAVRYARCAGDRAARLLAYEEAARLYTSAIEMVESHGAGDGRDRSELLLRLGDVQARAGDITSAKETFLRAAELARSAALPKQLARAALGYGGRFVWARAWGDRHLVPLLEEALDVLPVEDSELRVRLLARLAGGPLRDILPPEPREAMSQQAVAMARRLGDPAALAYALDGRYSANWGPDALHARLEVADELIAVAARAGDREREYEGRDFRFWALLESGDVRAARAECESKARLADELRQPAQLWDVAVCRATLALFEGRLGEAETAIGEAITLGRRVQTANARMAFDLQTYALRREQGRLGEVVDIVERAARDHVAYPVWRYVLVDVYAQLGRRDNARAAFEGLAAEGFTVQVEMQWLFSTDLLPEVCRDLGDARRAATLYERLVPYANRNAVTPPELCRGSVSRGLGLLAATMSRWERAEDHFERALWMNHAAGARPWLAHTRYDYARMLLARGEPGDRARAGELLDSARALSRELEMGTLAEKVSALAVA